MLRKISLRMRGHLRVLGDSFTTGLSFPATASSSSLCSPLHSMPSALLRRPLSSSLLSHATLLSSRSSSSVLHFSPHRHQRSLSTTITAAVGSSSPNTTKRRSSTLAAAKPSKDRVDREVEEYWTQILEGVDKPTAKRLIRYVDPSIPLGIPNPSKSTVKVAKPPCFDYFLEMKTEHPTKIILCRIGEFYETIGIDAILLVQHAGLNPMGKEGNIPRAGCPKANLRRTVSDLVEGAGLSVVVCEEVPDPYSYGTKPKKKQRYLAATVTPAAPHFIHGLINDNSDIPLISAPPLLGIVPKVGGYDLIEVNAELRTYSVTEGLTEDAVNARLYEGGLASPLYLHVSSTATGDKRLKEAIPETAWEQRVIAVFRNQIGAIERFSADSDPVKGMLERVKQGMQLKSSDEFHQVVIPRNTPRPLYLSSALNLGLHRNRGVPNLLDFALPNGAPLTARTWMKDLLVKPPPPSVGLAIHRACRELQTATGPIPAFPVLSATNVALKLRNQEANDIFFRELGELCHTVDIACTEQHLDKFSQALLIPAMAAAGLHLKREALVDACRQALQAIHDVVDHDTELVSGRNLDILAASDEEEVGGGGEEGESLIPSSTIANYDHVFEPHIDSFRISEAKSVLNRMFAMNEDFQGKIRAEKMKSSYEAVEKARQKMVEEVFHVLGEILPELTGSYFHGTAKERPFIVYDVNNNAVWLKVLKFDQTVDKEEKRVLIHPADRFSKRESGFFSTESLEKAQDDYRRACFDAHNEVREQLRQLAQQLQPITMQLVVASSFAVIASALDLHVKEAARRGWNLPQLTYSEDGSPLSSSSFSSSTSNSENTRSSENRSENTSLTQLKIDEMWPYWLGGTGGINTNTVKNSFSMDGMFLLTGPNMAGKSTLLRSTCAVALLGSCGLAVPAKPTTQIPYFDAFMLRTFSADSPLEGRSSFAVEMQEMRYVLQDATGKSLVLVDELGKGTEARAGAALAGAMLEELDKTKCKGVFATHLHSLLDMELDLPGTMRMKMEVTVEKESSKRGLRRPTWKMVPGESVESLALEVAMEHKLPQNLVDRAAGLYEELMVNGDSSSSDGRKFAKKKESSTTTSTLFDNAEEDFDSTCHHNKSSSSSDNELSQAACLLESTAAQILSSVENFTPEQLKSEFLPPGTLPPASTVGASCVYIARRPKDGRFYVGSSDGLEQRIKDHRRPGGGSTRVGDPKAEFCYIVIPGEAGASSMAKTVEAETISVLKREGYPLLSEEDARKRAPVSTFLNRRDRSARYDNLE